LRALPAWRPEFQPRLSRRVKGFVDTLQSGE
jgi:hypothetical protein